MKPSSRSLLHAGTGLVAALALAISSATAESPGPTASSTAPSGSVVPSPQASAAGLEVSGAWARESPMVALAGAAYLVVENGGDSDDAIVGASSPVAGTVELHRSAMDADGMMSMARVDEIPVPAHDAAVLEPGGYHIMLIDLRQPLLSDTRFALTLEFAAGAPQTISVPVMSAGPTESDGSMGLGGSGDMDAVDADGDGDSEDAAEDRG